MRGGPDKEDRPRGDETITNFFAPFLETTAPSAMVSRRDPYNEHNPTRGGARFQCDSSLPHPYMRWTQQWIQTMMHDIRIGSEAPKQRLPNLFPSRKAMGGASNRYLEWFLADRRVQAPGSPKLEFSFTPIACSSDVVAVIEEA